ncbi:uncharacterized protein N0V89_000182 [Didymosphaeria variabile]|uniref:Uncharacterized protein n=1 Tax=Didymosphaeria variabile TaxID=1932322 RepID=A0A9W9CFH3_9PLEO|nr:uncharacterized protein N0V89_000182 [Didymosphaeria variabile]KAJ4359627.1 hypothetical protein N0V89_000182 [Didymosphaeria variabile]
MWDFEIFDNASRGPWGSILLLIRTKGRALAALGAGITLFSLVLDPFFQQVVDFPSRWALQGTSSIPRTIWYEPRYIPEFRAGKEVYQLDNDISMATKKFFYDNGTQPVKFGNGYLTEAVDSSVGTASKNEVLLTRLLPLVTNPERAPLFGGSVNFNDIRNRLLDVLIVSAANGTAGVLRNETPVAHECAISWCVKTIESAYFMGTYKERVIGTIENTTSGEFPWQTKFIISPSGNGTKISYRENITIGVQTDANGSDVVRYGMDNNTFVRVTAVFDDIFPSFYTATNMSSVPKLRYKTNIIGAPFQRALDFNPWSAENNITRHLERMTDAITNVVRSYPNASYTDGSAFSQETYVAVRWQWLALPLALLILSAIFLIATIKKTADEGVWKSSAIATLLYGLPDHVQKQITTAVQGDLPRVKAKKLKVRLHATKGWRLSGNSSPPVVSKPKQYQPPPGWI